MTIETPRLQPGKQSPQQSLIADLLRTSLKESMYEALANTILFQVLKVIDCRNRENRTSRRSGLEWGLSIVRIIFHWRIKPETYSLLLGILPLSPRKGQTSELEPPSCNSWFFPMPKGSNSQVRANTGIAVEGNVILRR